jgi:hypothetical protein
MSHKTLRAGAAILVALLGVRVFALNSDVQSSSKLQGQSDGAVSLDSKIDFMTSSLSSQIVVTPVTGQHSKSWACASIKNSRPSEPGQQGLLYFLARVVKANSSGG